MSDKNLQPYESLEKKFYDYGSEYIIVYLMGEDKHLIYRFRAEGPPIISIEDRGFDDSRDLLLVDGVQSTWKDNEADFLQLIKEVGLDTTSFFNYINRQIGEWALQCIFTDSLTLKSFFYPGDATQKELKEAK